MQRSQGISVVMPRCHCPGAGKATPTQTARNIDPLDLTINLVWPYPMCMHILHSL